MKCDIVFHLATTTMSRCCNMPFVKRWWQDITCSADGACGPARRQMSEQHLDDFGKSGVNIINRPCVDHEKDTHPPLPPCCLATHPQDNTTQTGDTGGATLSNIVHWDMFLLLQVWRQSCARTQSMFCGEGF